MKNQRLISFLPWFTAILTSICYLPTTLHLGYVWDDWALFIFNPELRLPDTVWHTLVEPILPGTTYFRPLPLATLALEFNTYGVDPALSHAVNVAIHTVNTLLVGLIGMHLCAAKSPIDRALRVLLIGLFYGLHPALVEPVAWIAGRFDLLVTFFMLIGIWGYFVLHNRWRIAWVSACFLLAALSKEMAATFPLILMLFHLARQDSGLSWKEVIIESWRSREWRLYAALLFVGLVYIGMRAALLGRISHVDTGVVAQFSGWMHHLSYVGQTLIFYAKATVWPFSDLNPQHLLSPVDLTLLDRLAGLGAIIAAIVSFIYALRSRAWFALLLTGWLIALLPVLNIIPLMLGGSIGQERFLTFPLALAALSIARIALKMKLSTSKQRLIPALTGVLTLTWLGVATANVRVTIPLWQSDLSLWAWAYERYPDAPIVQFRYAAAAIRSNAYPRAQSVFDHAGDNINYMLKALKGKFLVEQGQATEGMAMMEEAGNELWKPHEEVIKLNIPIKFATVTQMNNMQWFYQFFYTALAEGYNSLRMFSKAEDNAAIALFYSPSYPSAWMAQAFAQYGQNRWDEGEQSFKQAMDYFVDLVGPQAVEGRRQFLSQLCQAYDTAPDVCDRWKSQSVVLAQ